MHWRLYQSGWDHDANAAHLASSFFYFCRLALPRPCWINIIWPLLPRLCWIVSIWLSLFVGMASNRDAWPNAYFLDPGSMRSYTAARVVEISKLAPGASRAWWFCGFPQQFLQRAWVDGNTVKPPMCGRPRAGRGGGPPISCAEYTPPLGAQENPQRVYVQDAETLTVDLIEAHSKASLWQAKENPGALWGGARIGSVPCLRIRPSI